VGISCLSIGRRGSGLIMSGKESGGRAGVSGCDLGFRVSSIFVVVSPHLDETFWLEAAACNCPSIWVYLDQIS